MPDMRDVMDVPEFDTGWVEHVQVRSMNGQVLTYVTTASREAVREALVELIDDADVFGCGCCATSRYRHRDGSVTDSLCWPADDEPQCSCQYIDPTEYLAGRVADWLEGKR